jgi:hypothetical protein
VLSYTNYVQNNPHHYLSTILRVSKKEKEKRKKKRIMREYFFTSDGGKHKGGSRDMIPQNVPQNVEKLKCS